MENSLLKYPAYKNSGVEWLGEIPEHWEVKRMKFLFKDVSEKNKPNEELLSVTQDNGVIPRKWVENRMVMPSGALESFKFIQKGDFAISLRSFEGGLEYCHHDGIISPAYTVLKAINQIDEGYYKYLFKSQIFISELQTSIVGIREGKNISYQQLCYSLLPIPPLQEQTAIANFLDKKTVLIHQAVVIKEKQIELLKERRQILIHQAVTKGLNHACLPARQGLKGLKDSTDFANTTEEPSSSVSSVNQNKSVMQTKLKDSGVEWIGEIPEGWEVKKLKYCLIGKLKYGANESGVFYDVNLPRYVRITDFGHDGKLSEESKLSLNWKQGINYLLKDGDILFARSGGTVGKTYQFKKSMSIEENYCYAGYLIKAESNEEIILSDFLYLYTTSDIFNSWKDSIFIKATIENIGADKYSQLPVILPSVQEQKQILNKFKVDDSKLSIAMSLKEKEIEKLKEYKASLINSTVTGKIKVC